MSICYFPLNRIFSKAAKGKKDSYVVLPDKLSLPHRAYLKNYSIQYLFVEGPDGRTEGHLMSEMSRMLFYRTLEHLGVEAYDVVHTLQNS